MNISGIRTGAGFYDYNSIKINEVRSQQIQEARESEQIPVTGTVEQNDSTDAKVEQIPAAQKEDYGVADFNSKYQPDASYDLKGVDSDISKLDVEKALSDLKKDQVHMGGKKVTTQNLEVVRVDAEKNLLLVKGAVPGPKKSLVTIKESVKAGK